ncbi:uncharacterized protein LOC112548364 [Alligator sinensis]|uniref:Uncharacterized protein LOC112548364 n=1 Tax=Alligator sinensis TaxID=38654 RepID=A0A3Q0FQZ3_ALLSI|nr:uncharacterized protein LOC112548364 [Alligator sinensis]
MAAVLNGITRLFLPVMGALSGDGACSGLAPWYFLVGLRLVTLFFAHGPWDSVQTDLVCNWTTEPTGTQVFCTALCYSQRFPVPLTSIWALAFIASLFTIGFMQLVKTWGIPPQNKEEGNATSTATTATTATAEPLLRRRSKMTTGGVGVMDNGTWVYKGNDARYELLGGSKMAAGTHGAKEREVEHELKGMGKMADRVVETKMTNPVALEMDDMAATPDAKMAVWPSGEANALLLELAESSLANDDPLLPPANMAAGLNGPKMATKAPWGTSELAASSHRAPHNMATGSSVSLSMAASTSWQAPNMTANPHRVVPNMATNASVATPNMAINPLRGLPHMATNPSTAMLYMANGPSNMAPHHNMATHPYLAGHAPHIMVAGAHRALPAVDTSPHRALLRMAAGHPLVYHNMAGHPPPAALNIAAPAPAPCQPDNMATALTPPPGTGPTLGSGLVGMQCWRPAAFGLIVGLVLGAEVAFVWALVALQLPPLGGPGLFTCYPGAPNCPPVLACALAGRPDKLLALSPLVVTACVNMTACLTYGLLRVPAPCCRDRGADEGVTRGQPGGNEAREDAEGGCGALMVGSGGQMGDCEGHLGGCEGHLGGHGAVLDGGRGQIGCEDYVGGHGNVFGAGAGHICNCEGHLGGCKEYLGCHGAVLGCGGGQKGSCEGHLGGCKGYLGGHRAVLGGGRGQIGCDGYIGGHGDALGGGSGQTGGCEGYIGGHRAVLGCSGEQIEGCKGHLGGCNGQIWGSGAVLGGSRGQTGGSLGHIGGSREQLGGLKGHLGGSGAALGGSQGQIEGVGGGRRALGVSSRLPVTQVSGERVCVEGVEPERRIN